MDRQRVRSRSASRAFHFRTAGPALLEPGPGIQTGRDGGDGRIARSRPQQPHGGIGYKRERVERVDLGSRTVHLVGGLRLAYDVLVVATGAQLLPEETPGLTGPGWGENVFTFSDLPGAVGLRGALEHFQGGRVVVDVADLPYKCPVAPLEFALPERTSGPAWGPVLTSSPHAASATSPAASAVASAR